MAQGPQVNLSYIGFGPTAQGQTIVDQLSGAKSKTLYAYGILTNGNTTTANTGNPVAFIDGIQSVQNSISIPVLTVTAPATIGGVANQAVYSGVGAYGQLRKGQSITFAGFTNSGNNGTFTINALTTSSIQVTNSSSVAETNPAGTVTYTVGSLPTFVDVFVSGSASDTTAAIASAVAAPGLYVTGITGTGFNLNWSAFATTAQTVHFGAIIAFSS